MTVPQKPAAKKSKYIESGSESGKKSDKESDEDIENEVHEGKSKVVHEGNKPVDNRHHKCPDCDKNFPTPSKLQSHYCCGVPSGKSVDHAKKLNVVKKRKLKPATKRLIALKLSLEKEGKMLREIGFRECGHKICMIKAPNVCGICGKEYIEIDDNSYVIENENIEDSDPEIVEIKQETIETEEN